MGRGVGIQNIPGLDDEAPTGPDDARAGQGEVLGEGELLGGTCEVGDAGDNERPLVSCVSFCYNIERGRPKYGVFGPVGEEDDIELTFMTGALESKRSVWKTKQDATRRIRQAPPQSASKQNLIPFSFPTETPNTEKKRTRNGQS